MVGLVVLVSVVVAAVVALTGGGADGGTVGEDWSRVAHSEPVFGGSVPQLSANGIASGDSVLVAVGSGGDDSDADGAVWLSQDGLDWERVRTATMGGRRSQFLNAVAAAPSGFVAVGVEFNESVSDAGFEINAAVWTSPDGRVWSRVANEDAVFGADDDNLQFMNDVVAGGPGRAV